MLSFGAVASFLIILGAVEAFRRARWYFWFSLIAFVFAGPFFVWISDLSLATAPSGLFVLQRFFLLPRVVLAPLVAFGVVALARFVARATAANDLLSGRIVAATCLATIVISIATSYQRIDQSRNFIARQFAADVFNTVPSDSILLVSGDGFAFPLLYLQKVEHVGTNSTLVVLPMLLSDWYAQQLRAENPDLVIPFDRYDRASKNLRSLVEANPGRRIALAGTLGDDHSLDIDYWPYQQGLLTMIVPRSQDRDLRTLLVENERLVSRYHPPAPGTARMNTFEADIISIYQFPALRLGDLCQAAGLKDEARDWYQRALAINPQFSQAREALARLEH
jgi:tetratricopeptide (TPR) repeat protein